MSFNSHFNEFSGHFMQKNWSESNVYEFKQGIQFDYWTIYPGEQLVTHYPDYLW